MATAILAGALLIFAIPCFAQTVPLLQTYLNNDYSNPYTESKIVLSQEVGRVRFVITPSFGITRYRLVGYDQWREHGGEMYVGARFYDVKGDYTGETRFLTTEQSPGWHNALETSTFTPRQETVKTPAKSAVAEIFTTSAGPPSTVGILAVTNFGLYQDDKPLGSPYAWHNGGDRPSMAFEQTVQGLPTLVINDIDPETHADWYSSRIPVQPDATLSLRWQGMYSVGSNDRLVEFYDSLPPGDYHFEVEVRSMSGSDLRTASVEIIVRPPFWRTWWFWTLCFAVATVVGVAIGMLWSHQKASQREEKNRLIEEERRRIARDLHDDLGARIAQISLASSNMEGLLPSENLRDDLRSITGMAQELGFSLSEAVWMLNSQNDHLESLIEFLCRLLTNLCKPSGVRSRIEVDPVDDRFPISSDFRHHVSLAVREAITNALRHSNASEIRLSIKVTPAHLTIQVTDNGIGIPANPSRGNGLTNMEQRITQLNGSFRVKSQDGNGTQVTFDIPLPSGSQKS